MYASTKRRQPSFSYFAGRSDRESMSWGCEMIDMDFVVELAVC